MRGACHHCGWNRATCPTHGQAGFRVLPPSEAAQRPVACSLCGADLFPANLGHGVIHVCVTGEVTPA